MIKVPLACPRGTKSHYRYKTTKTGKKIRLGGCAKKGKFIKDGVKEVKVKWLKRKKRM